MLATAGNVSDFGWARGEIRSRPVGVRAGGGGRGPVGSGGSGGGGGGGGDGGEGLRWVTVAVFNQPPLAHLARMRLEGEGIPCVLVGDTAAATDWMLTPAGSGVKLKVPEPRAIDAREVLERRAVRAGAGGYGAGALELGAEAEESAECSACGEGRFGPARLSWWYVAVSVLLLGVPLLFAPRRWECDRCGAPWSGD